MSWLARPEIIGDALKIEAKLDHALVAYQRNSEGASKPAAKATQKKTPRHAKPRAAKRKSRKPAPEATPAKHLNSMSTELSEGSHAQPHTAPKIFISYRRADTASEADRLFEKLCDAYEPSGVFYDKESIGPGEDYEKRMLDAAENTLVMLVMVGQGWQVERLHEPNDAIVKELEAAFKGGAQVLPVLVGGAVMPELSALPKGLAWFQKRNAVKLGSGSEFRRDFPDLLKTIRALIAKGRVKDAGTSDVHIETYRDLFRQSLLDDRLIDATEREGLHAFAAEHELSFSDVRAIEREVRAELDSQ